MLTYQTKVLCLLQDKYVSKYSVLFHEWWSLLEQRHQNLQLNSFWFDCSKWWLSSWDHWKAACLFPLYIQSRLWQFYAVKKLLPEPLRGHFTSPPWRSLGHGRNSFAFLSLHRSVGRLQVYLPAPAVLCTVLRCAVVCSTPWKSACLSLIFQQLHTSLWSVSSCVIFKVGALGEENSSCCLSEEGRSSRLVMQGLVYIMCAW